MHGSPFVGMGRRHARHVHCHPHVGHRVLHVVGRGPPFRHETVKRLQLLGPVGGRRRGVQIRNSTAPGVQMAPHQAHQRDRKCLSPIALGPIVDHVAVSSFQSPRSAIQTTVTHLPPPAESLRQPPRSRYTRRATPAAADHD